MDFEELRKLLGRNADKPNESKDITGTMPKVVKKENCFDFYL